MLHYLCQRLACNHSAIAHTYNAATCARQWSGTLKPKSYSLVHSNQIIVYLVMDTIMFLEQTLLLTFNTICQIGTAHNVTPVSTLCNLLTTLQNKKERKRLISTNNLVHTSKFSHITIFFIISIMSTSVTLANLLIYISVSQQLLLQLLLVNCFYFTSSSSLSWLCQGQKAFNHFWSF